MLSLYYQHTSDLHHHRNKDKGEVRDLFSSELSLSNLLPDLLLDLSGYFSSINQGVGLSISHYKKIIDLVY